MHKVSRFGCAVASLVCFSAALVACERSDEEVTAEQASAPPTGGDVPPSAGVSYGQSTTPPASSHESGAPEGWSFDIPEFEAYPPIPGPGDGVLDVAAGANHTCAVRADGRVACWGQRVRGQLGPSGGEGQAGNQLRPDLVPRVSDVTQISATDFQTCAIHADQTVSCWGYELPPDFYRGREEPPDPWRLRIEGIQDAVDLEATGLTHCALRASGRVSCWGRNHYNMRGDNRPSDMVFVPTEVVDLTDAVALFGGERGFHARRATGDFVAWGHNGFGELGTGSYELGSSPAAVRVVSHAVAIQGGMQHACALTEAGEVVCWGRSELGATGELPFDELPEDESTVVTPLRSEQSYRTRTVPIAVEGVEGARGLAIGAAYSCALLDSGHLTCWGVNTRGQLGRGSQLNSNRAARVTGLQDVRDVALGRGHACAIVGEGNLYCWGSNEYGQIGDGTERTDRLVPVRVEGLSVR